MPNGKHIDWNKSIGFSIEFNYCNISGNFYINNYDNKNVFVIYNKNEYLIRPYSLTNCKLYNILMNYIYKYNIKDVIHTNTGSFTILDKTYKTEYSRNVKAYIVKCNKCDNIDIISENSLNQKTGCQNCNPRVAKRGITDINTTHPDIAKQLLNENDKYTLTYGSDKNVEFVCPTCKNVITQIVHNVVKRGLRCKFCSDGFSYPEKFLCNILKQINVNFILQLTKSKFKWCFKYKYDFYMNDKNCIIETHGIQHYKESTLTTRTLEEEQENDKLKEQLAKESGIEHYIVLDCRKSESEWIKKSVLESELPTLLNFTENDIDWMKCHKNSLKSFIFEASNYWDNGIHSTTEIANIMNLSPCTIREYLIIASKSGFSTYTREDAIKYKKHPPSYKVKCLNTNEIFESVKIASEHVSIGEGSIRNACKGISKYAGINPITKEKLKWEYIKQ